MTVKTHDASQFTEHDVSTEEYRVYHYPNGDKFRVNNPEWLYLKVDGQGHSHRVVDKSGVTFYPIRGWIGIEWKAGPEVSF